MKDPKQTASDFAAREQAAYAKAGPGLAAVSIGRAVLALVDAGKPVDVEALIAYLLAEARSAPLTRELQFAAAVRLGWKRPPG